jgi:hypothetical protein
MAADFKNGHNTEFKAVGVVLDATLIDWAIAAPFVAK